MNKRIKKYAVLFKILTKEEILQFLISVSKISSLNYEINESVLNQNILPEKELKKINKTEDYQSCERIFSIINHFRDNVYLRKICKFLESMIDLKKNKVIKDFEKNQNCGVIIYKENKKIDLSLDGYMEQLKIYIFNNFKGEVYGE